MSLRVTNTVEKNVVIDANPPTPIVAPAGKATTVLPDITTAQGEWAGRYVQNVGASDCYYALGHDCTPNDFNGMLSKPANVDANGFGSGQQFDSSNFPGIVSIYSVGGTTLAVTSFRRKDNEAGMGNIIAR